MIPPLGPHVLGEVQQRHALGDMRLRPADPLGKHPLRVPELLDEPPVRFGLLEAFGPSTLAILNKTDFDALRLGHLVVDRRYLREPRGLRSRQPPGAGHDDVAAGVG